MQRPSENRNFLRLCYQVLHIELESAPVFPFLVTVHPQLAGMSGAAYTRLQVVVQSMARVVALKSAEIIILRQLRFHSRKQDLDI